MSSQTTLTQDELKTLVGHAALAYVPQGQVIGVGTGSTVNKFIDALATIKERIAGAVSSSNASTERMKALGIPVLDLSEVDQMAVYVDGADEITAGGYMVKGGGAALTREKIVAAQARQFVCIVDDSKWVATLGHFPLPVEVIPMAENRIIRQFEALGARAAVRKVAGSSQSLVTDNGQHIVDVHGLMISDPVGFEREVSQWPGVVTVGVFAVQRAHVCLMATPQGVTTHVFE
jgi:ribose 5-phosphate isomerase A